MAKRAGKSASEAVAQSQSRNRDQGGGRFPTQQLSPDEMARWSRLQALYGGEGRGSAKRTLLKCFDALEAAGAPRPPSNAELLALLAERLAVRPV